MTDKPTPKEIDDLVYELRQAGKDDTYSLARAVLAKWGTPPAVAGEPVATIKSWTNGSYWRNYKVEWHRNDLPEGAHLYTTPQPTQAQAGAVPQYRLLHSGVDRIEDDDEFLSDDTTTWAIDPNGIFSGNIYGGHVLRPARRRIKGGQHGTE